MKLIQPMQSMKNIYSLLLIFLLIIAHSVFPDFRVVQVNGGSFSAAGKTTMSILDEQVNIKLFRDTCNVRCKFWIRSETQSESLRIAFPNSLADFGNPGLFERNSITNFVCFVDGSLVPFEKTKDANRSFGVLNGNTWFSFNAFFAKKVTHTIECFYTDAWSVYYRYLFGTAVTWNGPIQKGRIVFDHSNLCSNIFVFNPAKYKEYNENDVLPIKLKPESFKDSLVYTLLNYTPDSTEVAFFRVFPFWSKSQEPTYFDTVNVAKPLGFTLIGFENQFKYDFLGDSISYPFLDDYTKVRLDIYERNEDARSRDFSTFFDKAFHPNNHPAPLFLSKLSYRENRILSILAGNTDSLKKSFRAIVNTTYGFVIDTGQCKIKSRNLPNKYQMKSIHAFLSDHNEDIRQLAILYSSFLPINVKMNGEMASLYFSGFNELKNVTLSTSIDTIIYHNGINEIFKKNGMAAVGFKDCNGPFQFSFKIAKTQ